MENNIIHYYYSALDATTIFIRKKCKAHTNTHSSSSSSSSSSSESSRHWLVMHVVVWIAYYQMDETRSCRNVRLTSHLNPLYGPSAAVDLFTWWAWNKINKTTVNFNFFFFFLFHYGTITSRVYSTSLDYLNYIQSTIWKKEKGKKKQENWQICLSIYYVRKIIVVTCAMALLSLRATFFQEFIFHFFLFFYYFFF